MRIGSPSDRTVIRAVRWLTIAAIALANLAGTVIVFVLLVWVLPPHDDADPYVDPQPDLRRRATSCSRSRSARRSPTGGCARAAGG